MGRLEKYKQLRGLKQRFLIAAAVFLFILISGIYIADSSINSLMLGSSSPSVFSVKESGSSVEVLFMNQKVYLNTQYLRRDMKHLQEMLDKLF